MNSSFLKIPNPFTDPLTLSLFLATCTKAEVSASPVLRTTLEVSEQRLIMVAPKNAMTAPVEDFPRSASLKDASEDIVNILVVRKSSGLL